MRMILFSADQSITRNAKGPEQIRAFLFPIFYQAISRWPSWSNMGGARQRMGGLTAAM